MSISAKFVSLSFDIIYSLLTYKKQHFYSFHNILNPVLHKSEFKIEKNTKM